MTSILTEPMSKPALFGEMRAELMNMARLQHAGHSPGADLQELERLHDEAAAKFFSLWRQAELNGLMRELSGYLSTTYGG